MTEQDQAASTIARESPRPSESVTSDVAARRPVLSRRRTLIYLALATTMLFFDGCGPSLQYFTVGILPIMRIGTEEGFSFVLESFLWSGLLFHFLTFFVAAWFIRINLPWLTRKLQTFKMLAAWVIVWAAHNSHSIANPIWFYTVYFPSIYIDGALRWLFLDSAGGAFSHPTITAWSGRINAAMSIMLVYLLLVPIAWTFRRFVLLKGSRWQFTLAGTILLMLVFGVGIGMLTRLWIFLSQIE